MNEAPILQDIVRREGRSLLQYLKDAYPWSTRKAGGAQAQLEEIISTDQEAVAGLGALLVRRRIPMPHPGPYPMHFTNINYVSLEYLMPMLVKEQQANVARLEEDLLRISDEAAREQVGHILSIKREHLQKLEELKQTFQPVRTA